MHSFKGFPWSILLFAILVCHVSCQEADSDDDSDDDSSPDLPPAPEFTVYDSANLPCVLFRMNATIAIEPKRVANKKTIVKVPRSTSAIGSCGRGEDSRVILSWDTFRFLWHFQKSRVSDAWYVDLIELSYNTSDKAFKDNIELNPGTVQTIRTEDPLTLYLTPLGRSYSCSIAKDIKIFDDKKISRVTITLNRIVIQPFAAMTQRQYGDPFQCPEQAGRRDESVPLIVGTTFAVVVLLTVAGYAGYRYFKVKKIEYDTME